MTEKEFKKFMAAQVKQIKKYKRTQSKKARHCAENDYALEWIINYSEEFHKKYFKEKKLIK